MSQITRYDFELEKIKVDYFTFNIKNTEHDLQKIAQFFNRVYKFNSYYYDKKIKINNKNPYFNFTNPLCDQHYLVYITCEIRLRGRTIKIF